MLQRKKFSSNKEMLAKIEVYFNAKDKLFYKKYIEILDKH